MLSAAQRRQREQKRRAAHIAKCARERAAENIRMAEHHRVIAAGGSCGWAFSDTCIIAGFLFCWVGMFF